MGKGDYLKYPIKHVDLGQISGIGELVQAFHSTSFQSRNLAKCFDVYRKMLEDPKTIIFMGLSGALVPGGMRKIISDMIKHNLIDVLVSTGANLYHDFFEAMGYHHYIGCAHSPDKELDELDIDRIYDTFADDLEFEKVDLLFSKIANDIDKKEYSSREFMQILGSQIKGAESILGAAYKRGTPVFCPALSDSGIGIGLTDHYFRDRKRRKININQIRDNFEIMQIKKQVPNTGVLILGGGVPKNYIQQIGPMLEVLGYKTSGHKYAVQITTDDPKWGGLSGCTFSEGSSWGKIDRNALYATVYVDATIGLPLLVGSILQTSKGIVKNRKKRRFRWDGDKLRGIDYGKKHTLNH